LPAKTSTVSHDQYITHRALQLRGIIETLEPVLRWESVVCLTAGVVACGGAPHNQPPSAESMRLDPKIVFPRFIRSNAKATTVIVFIHGFFLISPRRMDTQGWNVLAFSPCAGSPF
jgi:hypothetical protein